MITGPKTRRSIIGAPIVACLVVAASVVAQTGADAHGPAAAAPPPKEPPAKIMIDSPLAERLARGEAVVHYRSENLLIAPLFGRSALSLSPRVGHVHVNVDDVPWVWAHTSREPVIVVGLSPGPHKVRLQLMTATHQWLDEAAVNFNLPDTQNARPETTHTVGRGVQSPRDKPPVRIVIDSPLPEPLARGVVFIRHHIENQGLTTGHIRVTVDDTPWHWIDTTGTPVIVQGLSPGRHRILIEHADADDRVIDHSTVEVLIPVPHPEVH
jgi:hypothetical protein